MTRPEALLDTNVVVAALVEAHPHHRASTTLVVDGGPGRFAVAAHSYAEAFNTLTRGGAQGVYGWSPDEAWDALERVRAWTRLVGLTPSQTLAAVRAYAASGGTGARLYDRLIGETAVQAGLGRIVTWNTGHMRALFPGLEVVEPAALAKK